MQICKVKNYQELSRKAANLIAAQVILKPDSVLGLATGSSPVGTYEHLVEMYENGDLDFSQVTTVNLDEYKGLAGSDEQSYRYFYEYPSVPQNKYQPCKYIRSERHRTRC